jgi:hypothetical protein|tara:strand:+ start:1198 stop:1413 length:216 start_codon:yes stop_codon:yes gene_type:complete
MPRIDDNQNEDLQETIITSETNIKRKCNFSNRWKFCTCVTLSLLVAAGFTVFNIYLVETNEDGSSLAEFNV